MSPREPSMEMLASSSAQDEHIFAAPWDALDDAALLAHFQGPRSVRYYVVADADETEPAKIEALIEGRFEFNGETHVLDEPIAWLRNPSADIEWHILLHKFYYAVGLGLAFERDARPIIVDRWTNLIDGWMRETPPGFIAADVTGRRVQNWIYSYRQFVTHAPHDTSTLIDPTFHRRLLISIHRQVEYLRAHLAPKRNHRTLELYAIFLAGVVFPEMREATSWRTFALDEIVVNMQQDLLVDGVQCELSTDYHHVVLKNYLHVRRLASINGIRVPIAMDLAVLRALEFSLHVHKPDGIVPSLSDGDTGSFLDLLGYGADLYDRDDLRYVATRGIEGTAPVDRVAHFAASGYTIVRSDWGHDPASFRDAQYLVLDSGPLGEGNHGHFDCLSFELAAFGRSLIVDPGRYTYSETGPDNWRVHFRGTAAHNTVSVDAKQQTRYEWQGKTSRHKVTGPEPDSAMCERLHGAHLDLLHASVASHEYDAVHQRCIVFVDRSYWIVSDWLRAPSMHCYVLNFQLGAHAQGATRIDTSDGLYARSPGLSLLQPEREDVVHELHDAWVSARYGDKQPAPAIRSAVVACDADFDTVLVPWVSTEPAVGVSLIEVRNAPGGALRIELIACGEPVVDHWFHTRDAHAARHCIDGFELVGRWAFWRTDAEGRVIRATSHEGAALTDLRGLIARAVALDTEDAS